VRLGRRAVALHQPVEPRLKDHGHEGDGDEDRHDRLEGRGGQDQQQHGSSDAAQHGGDGEAKRARPLSLELAPIADRARDGARYEPDRVRHVGGDR
jgi:hypothetical protein